MSQQGDTHRDKAMEAVDRAINLAGNTDVQDRGPIHAQVAIAEAILEMTGVLVEIRDELRRGSRPIRDG